jgi:hypothetical protein
MLAMTSVVLVCGEVIAAANMCFAQLFHLVVSLGERSGRATFLTLDDVRRRSICDLKSRRGTVEMNHVICSFFYQKGRIFLKVQMTIVVVIL